MFPWTYTCSHYNENYFQWQEPYVFYAYSTPINLIFSYPGNYNCIFIGI